MCEPSTELSNTRSPVARGDDSVGPVRVVVAGAGPSGLLTAINLLRRNNNNNKYHVTIIDAGPDHGVFTAEDLKRYRSWMIGLSTHGLTALKRVPDLYEKYVSQVGILMESFHIHIGRHEIKGSARDNFGESYVVDRNFICAALARYLNEHFADCVETTTTTTTLQRMYETKILYVDGDNQRLLTRKRSSSSDSAGQNNNNNEETYVDYDVLIGCDGVRSCVRECMLKNHRDFECSVDDIFNDFKAVHIDRPSSVANGATHVLPGCLKNINGIGLPELGDKLNLAFGYPKDTEIDQELHSQDQKVVKLHFQKHFKAFELDDYDDLARQWVDQDWSQTGQVHCNYYHSTKLNCLIMGDAAHATSPSIGQGMNTALADAAVLDELLDTHCDDWNKVLPDFSTERVKEGNALTYLAYYAYSSSATQATYMQVTGILRTLLNKYCGNMVVMADPMSLIPQGGKLSVAYDQMVRLGRLPAVRKVMDKGRLRHFERMTGMVTHYNTGSVKFRNTATMVTLLTLLAVGVAYYYGVE